MPSPTQPRGMVGGTRHFLQGGAQGCQSSREVTLTKDSPWSPGGWGAMRKQTPATRLEPAWDCPDPPAEPFICLAYCPDWMGKWWLVIFNLIHMWFLICDCLNSSYVEMGSPGSESQNVCQRLFLLLGYLECMQSIVQVWEDANFKCY